MLYFGPLLTDFLHLCINNQQVLNIIQKTYRILLLLVMALFIIQCANPVTPQGGPKDETPPAILDMNPSNYSTSFHGERLIVQFDEYVKLQGLNKQLMISPPLANTPPIRTKGKSIVIEIDEQLRDSTTYTFYFGNSIVDITESNPLKNFEYVFSTGSLIDSMAIKGTVLNAFDKMPKDGIAVLLYTLDVDSIPNDSLPMLSRPVYVSRTNDKGEFELNNLRNVPYKLMALLDMNSNYLYDLPNEEIAFSDTIIMPAYLGRKIYIPPADTMKIDSTKKSKDMKGIKKLQKSKLSIDKSKRTDSTKVISSSPNINKNYRPHQLFMFLEVDSTQQILESSVSKGSLINIRLKYPCHEFQLNPINFFPLSSWNQLETNRTNDTILCWVYPEMPDSLQIEFVADSIVLDTLNFVLNKINPNNPVDTTKVKPLSISNNIVAKMELGNKLILTSEYPLINYNFSNISWFEDSLVETPPIIFKDSVKRIFTIDRELKEKTKYKLIIPDSAMIDMKGRINDSIIIEFETRNLSEYGTIAVNTTLFDSTQQWIIQLIDDKKTIVSQRIVNASQKITFEYLKPAKFRLKAILDENKNGRWDTGDYLKHRQAEKVLMFDTELEVRANWVMDQNWELK